ncbi:MAG: F0F1 ATP synthase subunit delta [Minisyncoccia bacterium]
MKYDYKTYAKALVLALNQKVPKEKIILNFLNLLKKNNDWHQLEKIIDLAEKLIYEKENKKKIIIETARPQQNLVNQLKKFFPQDELVEKINPNLIAGLKILINNELQLDFSLKNRLEKILK